MSLILNLRHLIAQRQVPVIRNGIMFQRRGQSVVPGPPGNCMSDLQRLLFGIMLGAGILYLPVKTIYHIREYAGTGKSDEAE